MIAEAPAIVRFWPGTDEQVIEEAAKAMLDAQDTEARDEACKQMIEALLYTKSLQWWDQFDIDVSECGS